jgi:O-antigen ligase
VCLGIVVVWLNPRKLPQLIGLLAIAVAIGAALGMIWKPDSLAAIFFRMTSVSEEIDHGYSAQWRFWEAEAMLPHIWQHPLAGIGLGADYKGATSSSILPDLNLYVHNAYLYMAGKMGLPALAAFLSAMTAILLIGRRSAKSGASPWARIVGAACAAMMFRFVFASITEPHLMSDYSIILIAVAGALVYLSAQRAVPVNQPAASGTALGNRGRV